MPSEKSRSKAMALVAALAGVNSIGVAGDDKDQLVVVGDSVDAVCLARCLRRKIDGHAVILHIGVAGDGKDKKPHERKDGDLFEKPDLQLPEHQPEGPPAMVPVRRTFNMSKVHRRRVRLPVVRKPRMMTPRTQHLSSQRSTARRVLPLFVWCALCFVMLLASVFGH
ncbi:hypothetical protein PR202_gb13674 [Eleusine coracana subsp. coracana]|uniref:Uncharacterized protein n=1 Tax=Eleusine coracana subsp. coracana TaxID=191504 RepID=A0AAV5EQY6_ELECO|nr:hypothetical protein PR202_gb13674 [Eleusine coracana subsp. coracana]